MFGQEGFTDADYQIDNIEVYCFFRKPDDCSHGCRKVSSRLKQTESVKQLHLLANIRFVLVGSAHSDSSGAQGGSALYVAYPSVDRGFPFKNYGIVTTPNRK